MGRKEFEQFLNTKDEPEKKIDPEKEIESWKYYLNELYSMIQSWLKKYVENGKVKLDFIEKNIHEEHLGYYKVKSMRLYIHHELVLFDPIGTIIIGTKGRVDMKGKKGVVKLVLADKKSARPKINIKVFTSDDEKKEYEEKKKMEEQKEPDWVWKIATSAPNITYMELNEDSFFELVMDLINE